MSRRLGVFAATLLVSSVTIKADSGLADHSLSSRSLPARVATLEHQQAYMQQLNMPQALQQLRDELQHLTGQLAEQAHQIDELAQQQQHFYQATQQRIAALANSANATALDRVAKQAALGAAGSGGHATPEEQKYYQAGFEQLQAKNYAAARSHLQQYLNTYPNGQYRPNCYYWLGELNLLQGKLPEAVIAFNTVLANFPHSAKVPDALLKLARAYSRQGKQQAAQQVLQQLQTQYPSSSAATKIPSVNQ